tara:strand:+ start:368 stop:856 length:489 start_codon:yes stop_codon:yes gene_type:complete
LKELVQRQIFNYLLKKQIQYYIGVPDSTMKYFIDEGLKKEKIIIANREEEAIGIATGMILSKCPTLVFMQNAGFANSLSTITSLVQLYRIPMIFLIGWRGFLSNDAPEHKKIGEIQPHLLDLTGLENRVLTEKTWKKECDWALTKLKKNLPCALIIKRETAD